MADFETAVNKTIFIEGGYSDDPDDSGGKTKYGITEETARDFGYTGEMKDLTIDEAKLIYKKKYWDSIRLDEIKNQKMAEIMFDFGVNCWIIYPIISLQRALNILNRNATSWEDLLVDGVIGRKTLGIANSISEKDTKEVCITIIGLWFEHYILILEKNTKKEKYARGWMFRRLFFHLKDLMSQ